MKLFTIGFTKTSAAHFFKRLADAGVSKVIDVRLNNVSQLAGFAKRDDLRFFLHAICKIDYEHLPELAPTREILDAYKKHGGAWEEYEVRFRELLIDRRIERTISPEKLDGGCLLCSEDQPDCCHRRLVAEYLAGHWPDVEITHL
jgi:uncharacterized protein (DUF488 family)